MPTKNTDLHGNVPDTAPAALLLIDVINDMEFPGGDELLRRALPAAAAIARLKRRAKAVGIPSVYVNDNYGRWQSDFAAQVDHCLHGGVRGQPVAEVLRPDAEDYSVLKPKHSGFFSTTLKILLDYLHAQTLIITGFAGNVCVLFTANDAFMYDFHLVVPADCIASESEKANHYALDYMRTVLGATVEPADRLDLSALTGAQSRGEDGDTPRLPTVDVPGAAR